MVKSKLHIGKKDKIFLAGHKGLVGNSVFKKLKNEGYQKIITASKKKTESFKSRQSFKIYSKDKT